MLKPTALLLPLACSWLMLASCATTDASPQAAANPLAGTRWELVQFQSPADGAVTPRDPTVYTMELNADGALAMRLDCNRAAGRWEAKAANASSGSISFGQAAMTRAACLGPSMDTRISMDLERVRTFTLEGDRLKLALEADGGVYTWRRLG